MAHMANDIGLLVMTFAMIVTPYILVICKIKSDQNEIQERLRELTAINSRIEKISIGIFRKE